MTRIVYALTAPGSTRIYVGQTRRTADRRLWEHKNITIKFRSPVGDWVKKYKDSIQLTVLETLAMKHQLNRSEIYWISLARQLFGTDRVLNGTDGGKTNNGNKGKTHSQEHRRKISEALKGRPLSDETKRKLSVAGKGRTYWLRRWRAKRKALGL